MNRNQKLKFASVFVVLAISVWLLWPTITLLRMSDEAIDDLKVNDPARYNELLDKSIRLGLDLQGGTYLVLEVDLEGIDTAEQQNIVDQALKVIRNRVDQYGVSEPSIQQEGDNRIVIQLPGLPDVERATRLINKTAILELKLVGQQGELVSGLQKIDDILLSRLTPEEREVEGVVEEEAVSFLGEDVATADAEKEHPFTAFLKSFQNGAVLVDSDDIPRLKRYLEDPAVLAALPRSYQFIWSAEDVSYAGGARSARLLYYCSSRVDLSGKNLTTASYEPDNDRPGQFQVAFNLDRVGANQFARVTERNVGRQLAIVLDNQVFSAPVIQGRIGQGRGTITGGFSAEEANDLAIVLRAGALPASMKVVEERTVGPSLGRDSIEKGFRAGLWGFISVIVFMLIYYRGSGLIATGALILNLLIVMAIMASKHATLTLPGIAGLILTVGMAVDANVLIYERIREELRREGSKVRRAIQSGYEHAFSTILDANLTTLITALVLYIFGTGPIRGFAVTLSLGIIASMYTALLVSRSVFDLFTAKRQVKNLSI
ncbi:MAG: protein translocase subunit SecD [Candidatus Krumholzibacteria bacterium]|nr:protein translocase subunit SecD [Candidatus Krumholzibacteria bacterium]MDP6668951.1 protein translocase subunit SecD [Candidatus Krumholzibacteria bacterium]MDP6796979.1 protein translocase subunit SecD [Candidatus Krumholzibacteria bacterium]MDP7022345.1 protein translocase subunit SecD [Candidatus Krumholzibacteria bacterium]